ncbi:N-6 DNA methylase [Ureibacillus aquaedulcis]|uniref:site-specific DNA-methyltransferase (adenine-specific) n=1 Tax=Ureibacillus aquaedulcis TaxID=3058421 RepID=A0ABT8GNV0_9BACL|nr:N-6 DNA methylase [Ureibacillus sp. BA0131]MDN4493097.1 N-6 DNA methylase [Ureibacillus sp. BA0131]
MKSVELRASKASMEIGDRLRSEIQYSQFHEVATRIFMAKFLLVNKKHSINIPADITWETISSSHYNIGNQIDKLLDEIIYLNKPHLELLNLYSLSNIEDNLLYDCLLIMDHSSLTTEEFQDFNLTGQYFIHLVESFMRRDKKVLAPLITPKELNKLMIKILKPSSGKIYDGAAGIGGSLIEAYQLNNRVSMFGQEISESNVALAYMNAIVNGIELSLYQIAKGDTLFSPMFIENGSNLMEFDYIVMNQPFGLKLNDRNLMDYDPYGRFNGRMGKTGKMHGDLAFLQHTVASLNEHGKAALIIPTGVLSRSSYAEKAFREYIVENDIIEAVVLLPNKILPAVAVQTVLLILNKNKDQNRKNKVLFTNAEEQYVIGSRTQYYLKQDNIDAIVSTYEQFSTSTKDTKIANLQEIRESQYNLNPNHYFTSQTVESEFGEIVINKALYDKRVDNKKSLKEIAKLSRGVNLPSKNSIKENKKGYKVIQLKDVENGKISLESIEVISVQNAERYKVQSGDIIIASRGTAFKVAIVPEHNEPLVLSNMFIRIRITNPSYIPEYIKAFLESPVGMALIEGVQKGGTVKALTTKDIEDIEFPNLDLKEQEETVRTVQEAEEKYNILLQQAQEVLKIGKLSAYSKMGISDVMERLK